MRLVRRYREKFLFEINEVEKHLLLRALKLYPLVPTTHLRLSIGKRIPDQEANQQLLEESLKVQRRENQKQVAALINDPKRFSPTDAGYFFTLSRTEIEWLLQVLNDVRVGSWLLLGSPESEEQEKLLKDEKNAPHLIAMELAGGFEMCFLDALTGRAGKH